MLAMPGLLCGLEGRNKMLKVQEIIESAKHNAVGLPDGRYVPSRPIRFGGIINRIRDAWEVLRGRADAVKWEGQ